MWEAYIVYWICNICTYIYLCIYMHMKYGGFCDICGNYGVATISRLLKIIGLFCKRAL